MSPVKDKIFDEEEENNLKDNCSDRGYSFDGVIAAYGIEYRVGEEDDGENEEEVAETDPTETIGLQRTGVLLICLNFVAREEGYVVCNEKGEERKPVEDLVNDKSANSFELTLCKSVDDQAPEGINGRDTRHFVR